MKKKRFSFNHICLYDFKTKMWMVYHKKDKRILKTVFCYGYGSVLGKGNTADEAIADAIKNGVKRYDVQVKEVADV